MKKTDETNNGFIIEPTTVAKNSITTIRYVDADGRPADTEDPDGRERYWADRIGGHLRNAAEHVIEAGRDLIDAKAELGHGKFERMVVEHLRCSLRTAEMLMKIARDPVLSNPKHASLLPAAWTTLYELQKLPPFILERKFADGSITPGLQRKDVRKLITVADVEAFTGDAPRTAAAKHKATVAPLQRLRAEINAKDGEIADLEERLSSAEAGTVSVWEALDDEAGTAEHIAHLIILAAGDDEKAVAIANAILAHFAKEESDYTIEDAPVTKRPGRPKGSKNKAAAK
jgi:hypothetical protein